MDKDRFNQENEKEKAENQAAGDTLLPEDGQRPAEDLGEALPPEELEAAPAGYSEADDAPAPVARKWDKKKKKRGAVELHRDGQDRV